MDLKKLLLNDPSLQSRSRRRRYSIADVGLLHTLHDIPEQEYTDKERRHSTGSCKQEEGRPRAASELSCKSTQEYYEGTVNGGESTREANGARVLSSGDCNVDKSPRYKPCFSFENSTENNEHLIKAVSTYVLSYTDDAGNDACNTGDVSPTTTGSSSPQESSKETSDEELPLSEMLRKVDTFMAPHRSRRGSGIDQDVLERITTLTPVVEFSRSSSVASVSINLNGSPEDGDCNGGSELGSRRSSANNTKKEEGMLGKILVSPRLTRRGSLSDVLRSLSPQFDKKSDLGRQETPGNDGKFSSELLSPHAHGHIKDPWRPLSPMTFNKGKIERDENPNIQTQVKNESPLKRESETVLGKIMNFPNLLKRRGSLGDILRTLSPQIGSSTSKVVDNKTSLKPAADKEQECNSPSKHNDGILGMILKNPALTRRDSIGNVLNTLSPNPGRRCPSPPLTIKCDTDDAQSEKTSPIGPEVPKSKDVQGSPGESRPKGLLAIVQQHVISHSQAMQRKRRNSIASTKPHTETLELSFREPLDTGEWRNENNPEKVSKSPVTKLTAPVKDFVLNKNNNDNSSVNSSNNNDTESKDSIKRCDLADGMLNSNIPSAVLGDQVQVTSKASSPSELSKSKEKSHISANCDVIFPGPRKLVGSKSMEFPRVQSPQRKISAPLPPGTVEPSQRKSSVNVIKRSPITFVIPNDKSGRTEGWVNEPDYQPSSGVGFNNSRFLPLSQEEADDYSRIKKTEASKSATTNSTITMSSRVTVHGGGGKGIVRKLGISLKHPPVSDVLPTEERFAALSERYASLKAKLEGSDSKQKTQDSSFKPSEKSEQNPNTDDKSAQSKCWTTVESIPLQQFADHQVSDKRVASTKSTLTAKDGGKQGTDSETKRNTVTSTEYNNVSGNGVGVIETINSMNSIEKSLNVNANKCTKPSIAKIQVENNGVGNISSMAHAGKTTLDLRPESPAQRSRTSVLAKLMNRKMGPRRKQSIVPRVAKRRSNVYIERVTGSNGVPASAAQFEKIRMVVESSVLRAPVRQGALTIQELLNGLSSCLTEVELVAICKECSKTLRTLDALGSLPSYVSLETVIINPSGTIKFKHLSTGVSIDDLFLAPDYSNKFASEKTCVFSLAATLWSAADWRLTEAEKPSLSPRLQELLVSMTDDAPDARPGLYDVLQTCETLQKEGDMTSRERCQALLWEYQASAAIEKDDTTKKKAAEEDKKHHDTLMGSISVAASFKGFLKQTAKPQERNPFVKHQNNQEPSSNVAWKPTRELLTNKTIPKLEEVQVEKNTVAEDSQKLKVTSSISSKGDKKIPLSDSTNDKSITASDANNNQETSTERKRGCSLTEDQKEQLLSLLASAKLNKNPFSADENDRKSEESRKLAEGQPIKPPSPSLYAYSHYGQSEAQMMFSPITPAASPSVHSDVSDNQMPSVPNATFVPIAFPIPSVAPVPMPPFWYMPQAGMMSCPQHAMSPMPYFPNDASVTSNQSVVSTDSDLSEYSDMDPRPKKTSSAIPRFDKSESSKSYTKQKTMCSAAQQNRKASKLPRPIWQTPVAKSRSTPVESEANSNSVRRRVPITSESNERSEEIKPVRARTPSPSLGRRASPKETNSPRSQTPPVYWKREGLNLSYNDKPRTRASTGSFPNWRPPSPSASQDGRRKSISSPSGSRSNSPVQRPRTHSRPSSPAGSRSNSPVSMLVSKFEQMTQESADNSPRARSNSVTSMISKFGSSSLVPEDRIVKGQLKPNLSASAPQPASKTGPLRPSSKRDGAHPASDHAPSTSRPGNSTPSRDRARTSESSDDSRRSSVSSSVDPREVQRSGSDPGSTDGRQNKLSVEGGNRLSSSHGNLDREDESTVNKSHGPRTRLLENIRKWTSQENITRDSSSSNALGKSVQERLVSGLSLIDDYSTKTNKADEKCSLNTAKERGPSGNFSSTPSGKCSSSTDLRNDYLIKSNHTSENLSKPRQTKDGSSNELNRKSSLDSEPVREKGSPRAKPRNLHFLPERDSSIQYCDVKSPKDFLWCPTTNAHKFEIPVDLAILEAPTPTVSSPLSSLGGFDLPYGGDGSILSPTFPSCPGSLKDFKPSNYFANVTFKCGEMEPERDTNCLPKRSSGESIEGISSDAITNRRDTSDNYVKRFERKILRNTGDIENEEPLPSSANGTVESLNCRDATTVDNVSNNCSSLTGNPNAKMETKGNPGLGSGSSPTINSSASRSTSQGSSSTTLTPDDSQTPRTRSRNDQIVRSRHPSGDSSLKDKASPPRNPPSPMTLRKLVSNPLPQEKYTSQTRTSRSKRNSLPTSQPIDLLTNRNPSNPPENRPLPKSSSQTNLSPSPKQVHKSFSQDNLSVRQTASDFPRNFLGEGSVLGRRKDKENVGKNNPHSKAESTNNPHATGNDPKSSNTNANPGNPYPSKERHGANESSRERNLYSPNPHYQANETTSTSSPASESSPLRYPYTRRGSTPAKGSTTIKPPPKAASNPSFPLYPKSPKEHIEFFGAAGATYPGNPSGSTNSRDAKREQKELQGGQHNPKAGQRCQSSEGRSSFGNPSEKVSKSSMSSVLPTQEQFSEHLSSVDTPGDSDVFYVPSSEETFSKSRATSGKTNKRFPSSSSSDSGLNMSDPDENQKRSGKESKTNGLRSPPTSPNTISPLHSPLPTSPKFPIGTSIFYDPREQQNPLPSSEKGPSVSVKDPANVALLSRSVQPDDASNSFQTSSAKSDESPNKISPSDSNKFKNLKSDVSKKTDKRSVDSSECSNNHPEKPREVPLVAKLAARAHTGKSTSKEFVTASTPPPDISGRRSSKSPPSSSRVDSKELLGQLVKKVLNSAAVKQSSSPKASFAESAISAAKEGDKAKHPQGKMFFLPDETIEAVEKEKTSGQGHNPTASSSKHKPRLSDSDKASKKKEQGLLVSKETTPVRNLENVASAAGPRSFPMVDTETTISPSNGSKVESSSPELLSSSVSSSEEKGVLSKIIDMIHEEFAIDGYMDDGVEDVNMAEYVLSLAGMSEENFKEAITDQYNDLYWDEDLLHDMYEAVTGGERSRRPTLQFSESTVSDISPPASINLSREESYLSLEPLYFNSISRSSSERSGTGAKDILMSPLGEATEFLPIKVIAPEMQADIQELLTPIFEDYHRVMGVKLATSVEDLTEKLGTKIMEISQQLMLERRAKKKSMNSYNKMADVENKKDVKDLASKLVNEIEECDKKIIYLKNVQRQLRNVYAERFGVDTSLLYSFLVSYNKSCVTLVQELNNNFLNFSPMWNQRVNESTDIVDESLTGPSLQSGTKLGLFSYLFDRHAMSQAYVRYFLYTFRYVATAQELFTFIREKCSASLRTDSSGQVYNHQLQIRYRALDLLSEWIDGYYQFDFKTNPSLIKELLAFVKDELILVDRSERGHYLMELIAEKQKRDLNNNSASDEPSDFVAVLQLEDPQGLSPVDGKKDSFRKPMGSRKSKSPVQCFRRATPEKGMTYKPTLYLKALSVLDHSSRILAEQLTLIQQDLFFHIHPVHFLNSRAHGIGVGRSQSPTRERDNIFGFSTGSRRVSELPASSGEVPLPWEQNMYVSEPSTDGHLENVLEHAQDVSLWVAVEICSASSIKAQLALITKFVNAARYCCEIRNYSTCIQIIDALEMFVIRQLPVWRQVPTKTAEALEELKAVKVLLKTDSSWLMKSEASRDKPTIPCFLLFVIHVQQQELGGFTLPNDMFKWTKMRSAARLVDQIRLFKQMRYAFQTDDEMKDRLKQRIHECKKENLHALASENASNFHLSSSHGSRKFHDAFKKMKATFGSHN